MASADLGDHLEVLGEMRLRHDQRDVPAHGFRCGPAVVALSSRVPRQDRSAQILGEDGVGGAGDHGGQPGCDLLRLAPLGDVPHEHVHPRAAPPVDRPHRALGAEDAAVAGAGIELVRRPDRRRPPGHLLVQRLSDHVAVALGNQLHDRSPDELLARPAEQHLRAGVPVHHHPLAVHRDVGLLRRLEHLPPAGLEGPAAALHPRRDLHPGFQRVEHRVVRGSEASQLGARAVRAQPLTALSGSRTRRGLGDLAHRSEREPRGPRQQQRSQKQRGRGAEQLQRQEPSKRLGHARGRREDADAAATGKRDVPRHGPLAPRARRETPAHDRGARVGAVDGAVGELDEGAKTARLEPAGQLLLVRADGRDLPGLDPHRLGPLVQQVVEGVQQAGPQCDVHRRVDREQDQGHDRHAHQHDPSAERRRRGAGRRGAHARSTYPAPRTVWISRGPVASSLRRRALMWTSTRLAS